MDTIRIVLMISIIIVVVLVFKEQVTDIIFNLFEKMANKQVFGTLVAKNVEVTYNVFGGNGCPLRKGEMPMYVTYENLIQLGLFVVALIGLIYEISHKDKK